MNRLLALSALVPVLAAVSTAQAAPIRYFRVLECTSTIIGETAPMTTMTLDVGTDAHKTKIVGVRADLLVPGFMNEAGEYIHSVGWKLTGKVQGTPTTLNSEEDFNVVSFQFSEGVETWTTEGYSESAPLQSLSMELKGDYPLLLNFGREGVAPTSLDLERQTCVIRNRALLDRLTTLIQPQ